jgi:hypothetical protein
VNCPAVRDLLAEHALGALPPRETSSVDRHLAWCAACRKEASELQGAAAVLAFSVAPAEPAPGGALEDRIVGSIRGAVERRPRPHEAPRRGRLAVAAVLAAVLAVSGLMWGAVMAGRAERSDEIARRQTANAQDATKRFQQVVNSLEFSDPDGDVFLATLGPTAEGGGGGSALTLVSPTIRDMAMVLVNGVPPAEGRFVPFTVFLRGPAGARLAVGTIKQLDTSGSGIVVKDFDLDLGSFDRVVVRDANHRIVMQGTISRRAPIESPSP